MDCYNILKGLIHVARSGVDFPAYLFHQGTNYRAWELLGAHPIKRGRGFATVFRVWAPRAVSVSVVGDFNNWDRSANPMDLLNRQGLWEAVTPRLERFSLYKFSIETPDGRILLKADPYAFHCEQPPGTASRYYPLFEFDWTDQSWLEKRKANCGVGVPINIYEVHAGSWRHYPDGNCFDYEKLAEELVAYVVDMGYTHIELLPLAEHPFDQSWGYQTTGYFAPTARYGTPEGLMKLVDCCHKEGIGVILDWVGGHFPRDAHGLFEFDGFPLYEYSDPHKGDQPQWGTRVFDFGRNEVQSFLVSNALYWVEQFHIDGIRVDAVAAMLYLDYGRSDDQWSPNYQGGRENLEAVAILKKLTAQVSSRYPDVLLIAEESTTWPMMTKPQRIGGMGFDYKWNMGWMNDLLAYVSLDPIYRAYNHDKLTFGLCYAFSENFVLPVSHDEVVHGKKSLINRMPGDYHQKFAGMRAFFGFMMAHPGKKLLFMGSEFGQFIEWDFRRQLDWLLLDYPAHQSLQTYVKTINRFYLDTPALYQIDNSWEGFCWLVIDDNSQHVVAFARFDDQERFVVAVVNFSPILMENYCFGVPKEGIYREVLNSDHSCFGGSGCLNPPVLSVSSPMHGCPQSIALKIPPYSCIYLVCDNP
jgi:1,4-alpha-glucan branching enzyme